MDHAKDPDTGPNSRYLCVLARVYGPRHEHAQSANWLHSARPAGRLQRKNCFSARAHFDGSQSGPHGIVAAPARPDRPALHALRRPRTIDTYLEEIARTPTQFELHDEFGVTHRLWPVSDAAFIRRIETTMADKKIIIADGHHRYETALNFRNECRAKLGKTEPQAAYEFAMMTFINSHSRGLTILPTHRLLRNVANFAFDRFRKALAPFFDWY